MTTPRFVPRCSEKAPEAPEQKMAKLEEYLGHRPSDHHQTRIPKKQDKTRRPKTGTKNLPARTNNSGPSGSVAIPTSSVGRTTHSQYLYDIQKQFFPRSVENIFSISYLSRQCDRGAGASVRPSTLGKGPYPQYLSGSNRSPTNGLFRGKGRRPYEAPDPQRVGRPTKNAPDRQRAGRHPKQPPTGKG